jgi:hypothetical protein
MAAAITAAELTTAHRELEEAEPNPVVHRELEVSVLLVVVGFVVLLGLFQAVTDLREEFITLRQLLSHHRNARCARLIRADGGGSRPKTT